MCVSFYDGNEYHDVLAGVVSERCPIADEQGVKKNHASAFTSGESSRALAPKNRPICFSCRNHVHDFHTAPLTPIRTES